MGGGCHELLFLAVGLGRPSICPVFAGIASANVADFVIVKLFGIGRRGARSSMALADRSSELTSLEPLPKLRRLTNAVRPGGRSYENVKVWGTHAAHSEAFSDCTLRPRAAASQVSAGLPFMLCSSRQSRGPVNERS
jgi:hypothetical protein